MGTVLAMYNNVIFGNCMEYHPDDSYGDRSGYGSPDTVESGDVVALLDTVSVDDDLTARIHGTWFWSWESLRLTFLHNLVTQKILTEKLNFFFISIKLIAS